MKFSVIAVFLVFLVLWLISIAILSGVFSLNWLPDSLSSLALPEDFASLGNAMTMLDGLFSSIAIILGLIAILIQGRELKATNEAQTLQAKLLTEQLKQQESSNRLGAYTARLQFLSAEIAQLELRVDKTLKQARDHKQNNRDEKAAELWQVIKNMRKKIERYRVASQNIDERIKAELGDI